MKRMRRPLHLSANNCLNQIRRLPVATLLFLLFPPSGNCLHSNPSGMRDLGVREESVSPLWPRPVASSIPFEAYGAYVFVPVRINGSEQLWFILDTGKRRTD